MANSTNILNQIVVAQAQPAVPANELFASMSPAALFSRNESASSLLTWAYYGGTYKGFDIANGTLALTASQANIYIVAAKATGVVSFATATTNWNNTTTYDRLYRVTTSATAATVWEDKREQIGNTASGTFVSLSDGPGAFTAQTLKSVRVNAGETALEYYTTSAGLSDAPSDSIYYGRRNATWVEVADKAYVDAVATGLDVKASVRAATTADITLSGAQTIDGVSVIAADRVLVKNQTAGADNGIYVAAAGAWARAADANVSAEVTSGMFTFVTEGTANGDKGWVLTTNDPITLATTALVFTQFSGAGGSIATDVIFDAKGDLAVGTGADAASRLAVGTNGQVLTADSAEATGAKWATPSAGGSATFTESASAPGSPAAGARWHDTDTGILYTYSGFSSAWVEF